jgi:hypothetical protein
MNQTVLFLFAISYSIASRAQTVFFKSDLSITDDQRSAFFAAASTNEDFIFYNAPDYQLYAFNKQSGKLAWQYALGRKSDYPPFLAANAIWVTNRDKQLIKLDAATGTLLKTLPVESMETQPLLRNDVLYFTGLYDGGRLIAYDTRTDSVLWKRFLAHGYSITPWYQADKIVANAEGDNWIELNYDGTLKQAGCDRDASEDDFPSGLPCATQFNLLTHDQKEIKGRMAEQFFLDANTNPGFATTAKFSFILNEGHLFIVGNKLKLKTSLQLASLSEEVEENPDAPSRILHADDVRVTMLYSNHIITYDHRDKKLLKDIDLSDREPHEVILENDKLWVISKKDGLLYGLNID